MNDKNGNVKWPHFITTIIGLILIIFTYSVSRTEFIQFEKRLDDSFTRVFDDLSVLKEELKSLRK